MFSAISLYPGADNLGDGFIQAGGNIILYIEKDKDCCETIKLNHPDAEVINGLVSEHLSTLPKADCIIGGPPCPEFSRANPNRTLDLCEVNNFKEAVIISAAKFYFMENVQDIVRVYSDRNFLINCADYGVPQTRIRRIFTNLPGPKTTHAKNPSNTLFDEPLKKWIGVAEALNINENWHLSPTGFKGRNKKIITTPVSEPAPTIVNGNAYELSDRAIYSTKYHQFENNYKHIRFLTNEELAILQGFRKDFKFYGSMSSIKNQIGNALPAIISKSFFEQILKTPLITTLKQ